MLFKIKNSCIAIFAILPMVLLLISNYSHIGLAAIIIGVVTLLISLNLNYHNSDHIFSKTSTIAFFSILSYLCIIFADTIEKVDFQPQHPKYLFYRIGVIIIIYVIALLMKRVFISKLLVYSDVYITSLLFLSCYNIEIDFSVPTFPAYITIIFFFCDYLNTAIEKNIYSNPKYGFTSSTFQALILNAIYALFYASIGERFSFALTISAVPDFILLCISIACTLLMFLSFLSNEKPPFSNRDSIFFLSAAFIFLCIWHLKEDTWRFVGIVSALTFITTLFITCNTEVGVAAIIREKLRLNPFLLNLIFVVISISVYVSSKLQYMITCIAVNVLILTFVILLAFCGKHYRKAVGFFVFLAIYALFIAFCMDKMLLDKEKLLFICIFIISEIIFFIPICLWDNVLIMLEELYPNSNVPSTITMYRKNKISSIWISSIFFWISAALICFRFWFFMK